mgnify:CR=1 FL=1
MVILKFQMCFTDRTDKEKKIAEEIKAHSCKSGFVKDVIWQHIQDKQKQERYDDGLIEI